MTAGTKVNIVIPVKSFARAKQRLAPLLSAPDRRALARAMFEDVLSAVIQTTHPREVIVVTHDPEPRALAREAGCTVIADAGVGLNAAIGRAIAYQCGRGNGPMLVLPADIPQVRSASIDLALRRCAAGPGIVIGSAQRDGGTNLLGCHPCDLLVPSFGPNSFTRHCKTAREAGIVPVILRCRSVEQDIDIPEDVEALLRSGLSGRTVAFLKSIAHGDLVRSAGNSVSCS